jgi:phosphomannomutase
VATRDGQGWRQLSGDEIGCVLGEARLAGRRGEGGRLRPPGGEDRVAPGSVVGTTVVSSTLLGRIAEHHGAGFVQTLTGFKWLAAETARAEAEGRRMELAYEQALGVMVGMVVRDKDGISAALAVADLAARCRAQGRTLADAVDDLARRHGLHLTRGRSVRLEGADWREVVDAALARLRARGPAPLDGVPVVAFLDYEAGTRTNADGTVERLTTPPTDLLGLVLQDGARLMVRPSGTEPLLKCYIEVIEPVPDGDVAAARTRATARAERLTAALLAELGVG